MCDAGVCVPGIQLRLEVIIRFQLQPLELPSSSPIPPRATLSPSPSYFSVVTYFPHALLLFLPCILLSCLVFFPPPLECACLPLNIPAVPWTRKMLLLKCQNRSALSTQAAAHWQREGGRWAEGEEQWGCRTEGVKQCVMDAGRWGHRDGRLHCVCVWVSIQVYVWIINQ